MRLKAIPFLAIFLFWSSGWASRPDFLLIDEGRPGFEGKRRILAFVGTLKFTNATGDDPEKLELLRGVYTYSLYKDSMSVDTKARLIIKILKDHNVCSLPELSGKKVCCQSQIISKEGKIFWFARYIKPAPVDLNCSVKG